jgi:hypothetical protein
MVAKTDRELLELAAKAAGIELDWDIPPNSRSPWRMTGAGEDRGPAAEWNPLTDDGDALRLAVKLNMTVEIERRTIQAEYYIDGDVYSVSEDGEKRACDPNVATRRAIVRAAAEIAKQEGA